jgi:4'-phosphopantetheinyl transferase
MVAMTRARPIAEAARSERPSDRRRRAATRAPDRRSAHRPHFVEGWRKGIGSRPRSSATLGEARVDLWLIETEALLKAHSCLSLLTEDDWSSLAPLQEPSTRYSAMAARVVLRLALSRAVDRRVAPSEWQFGTTDSGKPIVIGPLNGMCFSVSHVDELTAVAVASGVDLGIDVECVDQTVTDKVIEDYCHPEERRSLQHLAGAQRFREFLRLWTAKEAYAKLVGLGHSLDFSSIRCPVEPTDPSAGATAPAHFENLFVNVGHTLFHAAIAIDPRCAGGEATELQIVNLAPSQSHSARRPNASCACPKEEKADR